MKSEEFKMRFWVPENNVMIYSNIDYEDYYIILDRFGVNLYYTSMKDVGNEILKYMESFNIIESIPMLVLPIKDSDGNQIYDCDILECNSSDYYDPYGYNYYNPTTIKIIADVHDAYEIPHYAKIIGNKYENRELYRQTLWDLELKGKWSMITIESHHEGNKYPDLRKGQILFNTLSKYYPKIAEQITATEYDCFYDDSKIEVFKERVIDLWIEEMED